MLTDDDRAYFANLLASALTGNGKVGLSDFSKIKRCNAGAENDAALAIAFIRQVRCYDGEAYNTIKKYINTVDG